MRCERFAPPACCVRLSKIIASPASTSSMAGAPADEEPGAEDSASSASAVQRWCEPGKKEVGPFDSFRSHKGRNTTSEWAGCVRAVLSCSAHTSGGTLGASAWYACADASEVRDHPYAIEQM